MKGLEEETFRQELEDRLSEYFDLQRRFSTIGKRAVVWSLIEFLSVQVTYRKGVEKRLLKKIFQSENGKRALEAPEKGA